MNIDRGWKRLIIVLAIMAGVLIGGTYWVRTLPEEEMAGISFVFVSGGVVGVLGLIWGIRWIIRGFRVKG